MGRRGAPQLHAVVLSTLILVACASQTAPPKTGATRLRVVTSVAPITSIVAGVAGDRAGVVGVVPEGTDSHTFEPPASVAKHLARADVVFLNGLGLEESTARLARQNRKKGATIIELGNMTIPPAEHIYDFSFPRQGGRPNPHVWTNPPMAKRYAGAVADTLGRLDRANAGTYQSNYARFSARIDELDRAMVAATATVAPERRKLLTYHDAYPYLARQYGWTVIGAIQPSDFREPTAREVAALIAQIREHRVPAIFGSEVFPSPVLERLGKETGVAYVDVLRDDDLPGHPGEPTHSWTGLVRFDLMTIVESLGGNASAIRAVPPDNDVPDTAIYPQ